ncbi:hypothetical protein TRAPUB_11245 [Trametes pubescens]|uniref:Zn(2)-C6 fungal-type domain-containing protein n=2 Tax=Trametes TaxID=5324 RepID=A0A1M2VX73_TRAPU|nr:hypothetical protein TRAPUB_11245 [Trametes pubescens]
MNIPLFQFPPSLESEVAARERAQTHPRMQQHYDHTGALINQRRASTSASQLVDVRQFRTNAQLSRPAAARQVVPGSQGDPRLTDAFASSHEGAFQPAPYDPAHGSAFASVPRSLAPPHGPHFSQDSRHGEYVHPSRPTSQSSYDQAQSYVSPPQFTTPEYAVAVKHEEGGEEEMMLWMAHGEQGLYTSSGDAAPSGELFEFECKQENWEYTPMYTMPSEELFIDTSSAQQEFPPYTVDSPMSMEYTELPQPPEPSWQPMYAPPPPPSNTRSYTLEGAITPITPPAHAPFPGPAPAPINVQRAASPPPMGSLLPPASGSLVKIEPESSSIPPAPGPANVPAMGAVSSVVQKRPRGRPRKNPPSAQPPSPPPAVDYPFPHFPESASSSSAARPEDALMPPMSHPLPTLSAGTPGSVGPMPGSSGRSTTSETATLPAGQAIFRLNMHKDGEGDGAEGRETEKKKPIMACLFCRERKIACGPPPPGGPRRCNQCTRRDLVCEYPKESRRGQHKRGTRAARVEALASGSSAPTSIKPKGKAKAEVRIDTASLPSTSASASVAGPSSSLSPPYASCSDAPSSPLTPLSPHPPTERPSRSEKVALAQDREGKERSRSRAPTREAWDNPAAAARRAMQQQQKRRAIGQSALASAGEGASTSARTPQDSELAMAMGR